MSWAIKNHVPQCDKCGQFISLEDLMNGKAFNGFRLTCEDTISGPNVGEEHLNLCSKHNNAKYIKEFGYA